MDGPLMCGFSHYSVIYCFYAQVQQYVQSVTRTPQQIAAEKAAEARRAAKKSQEAMGKKMATMFKTVQKQAKQGMDPKSVLCEYFKQGLCVRGAKCKFSHDASQVRKVAKLDSKCTHSSCPHRNLYTDMALQFILIRVLSIFPMNVLLRLISFANFSWMLSNRGNTVLFGSAQTAKIASTIMHFLKDLSFSKTRNCYRNRNRSRCRLRSKLKSSEPLCCVVMI